MWGFGPEDGFLLRKQSESGSMFKKALRALLELERVLDTDP
jgi:hypothetical protein